jgi:hypothetical protein
VHRPLNHCVGRFGIHDIENRVNHLVPASTQNGGTQDLARLRIHNYLHEPLRFAFFDGTSTFVVVAIWNPPRVMPRNRRRS